MWGLVIMTEPGNEPSSDQRVPGLVTRHAFIDVSDLHHKKRPAVEPGFHLYHLIPHRFVVFPVDFDLYVSLDLVTPCNSRPPDIETSPGILKDILIVVFMNWLPIQIVSGSCG